MMAFQTQPLGTALTSKETKPEELSALVEKQKAEVQVFYEEFNMATDRTLFAELLKLYYKNVPKDQHAPIFQEIETKYKGDFDKFAAEVYNTSIFASKAKYDAFMSSPNSKKLEKDPAYRTMKSITDFYTANSKMPSMQLRMSKINTIVLTWLDFVK
ncbi:MAG: S46 family peptidase [Bacteroidetes bacterium]|nr:S46 family peptidase [Bacteroidota bacterium]